MNKRKKLEISKGCIRQNSVEKAKEDYLDFMKIRKGNGFYPSVQLLTTLMEAIQYLEKRVKELEEQNKILKRELKIIYDSHGKSYYDMDRIKLLVKMQ